MIKTTPTALMIIDPIRYWTNGCSGDDGGPIMVANAIPGRSGTMRIKMRRPAVVASIDAPPSPRTPMPRMRLPRVAPKRHSHKNK